MNEEYKLECPECHSHSLVDIEPPGWRKCNACSDEWWYAVADPAPPEISKEEKEFLETRVQLCCELDIDEQSRMKRIIGLRNYVEDFKGRPMKEVLNELRDKDFYIIGEYQRAEAEWHINVASCGGMLSIREIPI